MQRFDAADYPLVVSELQRISQDFFNMPVDYKADILISYLKDHSIKTVWIKSNPETAKLIISNRAQTDNIERLFAMCRQFPVFLKTFEEYFRSWLLAESTN